MKFDEKEIEDLVSCSFHSPFHFANGPFSGSLFFREFLFPGILIESFAAGGRAVRGRRRPGGR